MIDPTRLRTEFFTGAAVAAQMPTLAAMRVAVFRAFPYLYDGTVKTDADYTTGFAASATAGLAVAFDGDTPVGASTCIAMAEEDDHVTAPWRRAGVDLARLCYFGESVLLAPYRGFGIGVRFMALREAHARGLAGVRMAAFCAVERRQDHPLRPADHVPLDLFWRKRGYLPTDMVCTMRWKQVDSADKVENRLRFWCKTL